MYISKAMLNMRGESLGSTTNPGVELPWMASTMASANAGNLQGAGTTISTERPAAIVFSTGDIITDTIWNNQLLAVFSLNTLRTYLTANLPGCVMDTAPISTGNIRIVNLGNGKRMFDTLNLLGRFSYAKAFNRMYILLGTTATAIAAGTVSIASVIELTPQDLIAMGAPLTDNGDGTFNLNGTISLNNITWS
ncbi:hypothetical protein pEaSNUABM28_00087 [Erwinia phage pEa_SNUABM_28]|uniref:Uncharacterized protein n=1 Tax=Erwinia phage pEa_SNUABM_16 TaxID=2869544 RepID=A0AAE8XQP8_9CAUD|nr:hypothetical protein MPK64_gp085 [Erwinia phage pEa_SNUABM_16]QZE58644.1 hypothetical protein pEaSNUABM28_00087 [Erwinia phage pEa_SNUABM_28]QZE58988.1 hypothetical protein pEaSNUABM18_00085 [Erwinia phage pEa_SNUABM_18]UAW96229.1 hypothetical protein pEaSNUABM16_00085 [Erwinia phage pEa_SNUABM_16]